MAKQSSTRIDRALISRSLLLGLESASHKSPDDPISDHGFAIRVAFRCGANAKLGPGVWRFPSHLLNRPGVRKVVEAAAKQSGGDYVLLLARLNAGLRAYAKEEGKRVKATMRHLSAAVANLKQAAMGAPNCTRTRELLRAKESQLREYQASRRDRLHLMAGYGTELKGEVVSKHLSARVKARKQRTRIAELNVNGTMVCDKQGILDAAADFFNGLFGTDKRTHRTSWLPDRRLSAEEAEGLAQDWSEQEAKNAFKALACGKSPGLDGIPKELFELHWDILGECFMSLARSFEASASLPANTKEAVTILLHKKGDKGQISNYRPITLLNFTYKVLAKVVADRMKKVLHREAAKRQLGIVSDSGRRLPYLGYADDTTLLLQGREQIAEAGKMLDYFERVSGLATNKDKSVVMPLGRNLGGRPWRPDGFKWAGANDAERLLGVWVTASGDCKATWDKTLLRLLGEMGKWELKYLTITARAVVINGYITPIIAFQAQVYPPPQEV
ncbi:unnamed protein product [Closterium sp. NIES-65]|nr:unnamed protein product [Closterium sp. NIES-65]CAI5991650.1 unnamed protein product [Closterium sp. NIES-65]